MLNERKISVHNDNASGKGISTIDIYRLSLRGKASRESYNSENGQEDQCISTVLIRRDEKQLLTAVEEARSLPLQDSMDMTALGPSLRA
jgi:hypothetical protein